MQVLNGFLVRQINGHIHAICIEKVKFFVVGRREIGREGFSVYAVDLLRCVFEVWTGRLHGGIVRCAA